MHQLPLTYSMREAAAGLTAGGADGAARQGGGKGLALTPPPSPHHLLKIFISCTAPRAQQRFDIRSRRASGHGGTAVLSGIHQLRQF